MVQVSSRHHPLTATATAKRIQAFFGPSQPEQPSARGFSCHISFSDPEPASDGERSPEKRCRETPTDKDATPDERRRLGLRVCPQTGFAHDWSWFVQEYNDRAQELWDEAEPEDDEVIIVVNVYEYAVT